MTTLRLRPDLEDALRALPDVQAVSVVTSGQGVPTEVHVLASPGKPPKQVVRDVQSMAMAGFDLEIDHRIVSVVQIGSEEVSERQQPAAQSVSTAEHASPAEPADAIETATAVSGAGAAPMMSRPIVLRIGLATSVGEASATVAIRFGEDEFTGQTSGATTAGARPRLVAEAAVRALGELVGSPCEVETAQLVEAGAREVALVVLSLEVPRLGAQQLTGSALVRTHVEDAVVRAVLDALNRHLAG